MTDILQITSSSNTILKSTIADKQVIWMSTINKYLLLNSPVDEIVVRICKGESDQSILKYCINHLKYRHDEADILLHQIKNNLRNLEKEISKEAIKSETCQINYPERFDCQHTYEINKDVIFIEYENAQLEYLIHPKFAHLEVSNETSFSNHFQLFQEKSKTCLVVNGELKGCWNKEAEHFMTGKVSMEILQQSTHSQEKDWMAVFHAAGISNGTSALMFLGDSGNGKSTLSAILMGNGYEVLADDFLPVESKSFKLCSFPAAISVKKNAITVLKDQFPELLNSKEYDYPLFDKTVRYLSNAGVKRKYTAKVSCKALVFVKYEPGSGMQITSLPKDIAFQKLIPDSWISPLVSNAKGFLNWFDGLPCFQLKYSDNKAMLGAVKEIFDNEI